MATPSEHFFPSSKYTQILSPIELPVISSAVVKYTSIPSSYLWNYSPTIIVIYCQDIVPLFRTCLCLHYNGFRTFSIFLAFFLIPVRTLMIHFLSHDYLTQTWPFKGNISYSYTLKKIRLLWDPFYFLTLPTNDIQFFFLWQNLARSRWS